MVRRVDVAIHGAGPAGCALARRLLQLGHDVALIERRVTPRRHVESLSPGVLVHLDTLGIEAPSGRTVSKLIRWGSRTEAVEDRSLIVDRDAFDARLREGLPFVSEADARIVVDATGRASYHERRYASPRTFALRLRWDAVDAPDDMRIAAIGDGWIWGVRGADGSYHAAIFVDRSAAAGHVMPLLRAAGLFDFLTAPPDVCHPCDATPYVTLQPATAERFVVGDAACAISPLSSAGIQTALGGAIAASIAINTILRFRERTRDAVEFYRDHVYRTAARHEAWTAAHYVSASGAFFAARAGGGAGATLSLPDPEERVALHANAAVVDAPIVTGDVIVRSAVLRLPSGEHVAYLGGRALAPLLADFRDGITAAQLARSWQLAPPQAFAVMQWLVANEVLVRAR